MVTNSEVEHCDAGLDFGKVLQRYLSATRLVLIYLSEKTLSIDIIPPNKRFKSNLPWTLNQKETFPQFYVYILYRRNLSKANPNPTG